MLKEGLGFSHLNDIIKRLKSFFFHSKYQNRKLTIFEKVVLIFSLKGLLLSRYYFVKLIKAFYYYFVEDQLIRSVDKKIDYCYYNNFVLKQGKKFSKSIKELSVYPRIHCMIYISEMNYKSICTLYSLLSQKYDEYEIIVGYSKDLSHDIILNAIGNHPKLRLEKSHCDAKVDFFKNSLKNFDSDFVFFVEEGDVLPDISLYRFARKMNEYGNYPAIIYADNDYINEEGIFSNPDLKQLWSPETILYRNYLGKGTLFNTRIVKDLGGINSAYGEAFEQDLILKISENDDQIIHVPEILYHKKLGNDPIDDALPDQTVSLIRDTLERRNIKAKVDWANVIRNKINIEFELEDIPLVSIIIPTSKINRVFKRCVNSILVKTNYEKYEMVFINNGVDESEFKSCIEMLFSDSSISYQIINIHDPFNYSAVNNCAAGHSKGKYLIFQNNDTEIVTRSWIQSLLQYAQQKDIGAVGPKLLFPDDTIQHVGMFLERDGKARHSFLNMPEHFYSYNNIANSVANYTAITGACLMVSKEKFIECGKFDEKLKIEYNDVDLCLNLIHMGYRNVYTPKAVLYHMQSYTRRDPYSSAESYKRYIQEFNYFKNKWLKTVKEDLFMNPVLVKEYSRFKIMI